MWEKWAWGSCPVVEVGKVGLGQLSSCRCGKWGELVCNVSLVQLEFHFKTFLVSSIVLLTHTTVVWLQGEGAEVLTLTVIN